MDRKKLNINIYGGRTSATVDELLYDYFAVSIGQNPCESSCQRACEEWLEERLDSMEFYGLSFGVRQLMIAQIAKPHLEPKLQKFRISGS